MPTKIASSPLALRIDKKFFDATLPNQRGNLLINFGKTAIWEPSFFESLD
jgi:hypothetical protein